MSADRCAGLPNRDDLSVAQKGLASHPQHELAKRQMSRYGGMVTAVLEGGLPAAKRFLERVRIFALAESLGVDPRPFLVGVMMAASAAFATPFGYQTNVLVFNMGGYSYMDFVRVGLPLNLATWVAAMVAIPIVFPF